MELRVILRSLLILLPFIAAQVAIYRALRPRWRWAANAVAVAASASILIDVLALIWMFALHSHDAFGAFLSDADAVGITWLFTSTPAYVIYWIASWFGHRVPKNLSPERRQILKAAAAVAVASPFVAMTYGIIVGRLDFGVREVLWLFPACILTWKVCAFCI